MRLTGFSDRDVRFHLKNNSGYYLTFMLAIIIGTILAIIILVSNDSYLSLVVSKNKVIYNFINGTEVKGNIFFESIKKFSFPLIIVFLLNFNYYFACLSYLLVSYQFGVFILTISAIIKMYHLSGFLISLFILIPVNLVFFAILIYYSVICIQRSRLALKNKLYFYGFDKNFFIKLIICNLVILTLAFFVAFMLPLLLKSAIFSIY